MALTAAGVSVVLVACLGSLASFSGTRHPVTHYSCVDVAAYRLCVWPEDEYKIAALRAQVTRMRSLLTAAVPSTAPVLYLEPGVPQQSVAPGWDAASVSSVWALGGDADSWPAAQSITGTIPWSKCAHPEAQTEASKSRDAVLYDLTTNFVYGDVAFSGFSTQSSDFDAKRASLGDTLAAEDEASQETWIATRISQYLSTCDVSLELTP